ncbi:MAG TPA: NADPH:quinone oxidoreductase family protein [Polyangiaceae bacterium]|nr:NADPH:quinone oxidoreductase family protein [Polyangiaceae bacterium]
MRAIVCERFGPPSSLAFREVDDPAAGRGELVVEVKAAGVNFPDLLSIQNLYQFKPPLPFSPGGEVAGVVAAAGEGAAGFAVGDRVMALVGFGGFAERVAATPAQCTRLPDEMPFEIAAGMLYTYGTSYHALVHRAALRPGETVLVLGAAGGVGLAALQIAKKLGARVVAAASSDEKLALCRREGADEAVNYARGDLRALLRPLGGVDVVYDPVGGDLSEPALRALRPGGRLLVIGFARGEIPKMPLNLPLLKECSIVGVQWGAWAQREPEAQRAMIGELLRWWQSGDLRPHVHRTYPLERAAEALDDLAARRVQGKAILVPGAPGGG